MIRLDREDNGLETILIDNKRAKARISLQGAHVFEYSAKDKMPLLWMSKKSTLTVGKALRGGVPICWPWFGPHESDRRLKQHGFARTALWSLVSQVEDDTSSTVVLELRETPASLAYFPYAFRLRLKVVVSDTLTLSLVTENLSDSPMRITSALHTYFNISDISSVAIDGLGEHLYYDALTKDLLEQKGPVDFRHEVDRVYMHTNNTLKIKNILHDITVKTVGSGSTVVWNPWEDKSSTMADMHEGGYKEFVCVESANAREDFKVIAPKQSHTLTVCLGY